MATVAQILKAGGRVVVVGLAKSGLAAARFCHLRGARVTISEASSAPKISPAEREWLAGAGIDLETGGHTMALFTQAELIVVSPGVPLDLPVLVAARQRGVAIVGELGLAANFIQTPVVAVTGTNGKTTVTTLIGELCQAAGKKVFVGGNIGTPVTEYLLGGEEAELLVLEVSSFQLDTAPDFKPKVAVLLNISPDHLDRYESYDAYGRSKMQIFARQGAGDFAILNGDDEESRRQWSAGRAETASAITCCLFAQAAAGRAGAFLAGTTVVLRGLSEQGVGDEEYDLAFTHGLEYSPNRENAQAAILAARLVGCSSAGIREGLRRFQPLPHRLTPVAEIAGVKYLNDSKATNVGAVYSALAAMTRPVILIAGGRDKGGAYDMLAEVVQAKVKYLLLIGEAQKLMADFFSPLTRVERLASLEGAVARAHELAVAGDVVLLSPACASFDMFTSYSQRGEVFQAAVLALATDSPAAIGDGRCG